MAHRYWTSACEILTHYHSKSMTEKADEMCPASESMVKNIRLEYVKRKIKREILRKKYHRNKKDWFARKRFAKKLFLQIKNGKKKVKIFCIAKEALLFKRRDNALLNAFYPDRDKQWSKVVLRKKREIKNIKVEGFNIIDEPQKTFAILSEIVQAESINRSVEIDFLDTTCEDVTPYMIFALMKSDMAPINRGGKISPAVTSVVQGVGLDYFLGINSVKKFSSNPICFPFKLQIRRKTGTSTSEDVSFQPSEKEYISDKLNDTINDWFKLIFLQSKSKSHRCLKLTPAGKQRVQTMVTEALDNATRHSDLKNEDGSWAIAGFMSATQENRSSVPSFFCTIGIVSEGASISESIKTCQDPDTLTSMNNYIKLHNDQFPDEALATIFALQDGVSRIASVKGGVGLMEIIQFVRDMGKLGDAEKSSAMTLISGNVCLMIRRPYVDMISSGTQQDCIVDTAPRQLWFNETNDPRKPPDHMSVHSLDVDFPGTVIAIRFCIDPNVDLDT